jgi:hypothetical protein
MQVNCMSARYPLPLLEYLPPLFLSLEQSAFVTAAGWNALLDVLGAVHLSGSYACILLTCMYTRQHMLCACTHALTYMLHVQLAAAD